MDFRGRIETTDYELLTKAILSHWKAPEIDWEKVALNNLYSKQAKSAIGF